MMAKEFAEKPIKVIGSTGVEFVTLLYKDTGYDLKIFPNRKCDVTGHIIFAELDPLNNQFPSFIFRWDHGDKVVDVDILLNNKDRKDLWNYEGYNGHHAKLFDNEVQEYSFLIETPGRKIFEGTINVGLLVGLNAPPEKITLAESVEIKII
jgi:hypothetical protein